MQTSVFIAKSLDGYIARLDGSLDWLPTDDVEPHGYDEFIAGVDALVIGRGTYETVLGFGGWAYGTKPVIVLSASLSELNVPENAVCDLMSGGPVEVLSRLERRGFKSLYIDGGETITRFLAAGLIQRMIVTTIPVLIGSGIPLFGTLRDDIRWEHVATRTYRGGLVQSEYIRT
jgi:dihydrofolate reductase